MLRPFLLSLVLLLSACTSLAPPRPEVALVGVELLQAGLFEQHFALSLRLQNPGTAALDIKGLNLDVELNGQPFARGVSTEPVSVPARGEALLVVQATSNLAGLLRQLRELKNSGGNTLIYRIHGSLEVGIPIPFQRQGEIDLSRLLGGRTLP